MILMICTVFSAPLLYILHLARQLSIGLQEIYIFDEAYLLIHLYYSVCISFVHIINNKIRIIQAAPMLPNM